MAKPLTDAELAAILARCEAATPGPWVVGWNAVHNPNTPYEYALTGNREFSENEANLAFAAAAREDLPRLLDEVERLRGLLAQLVECDEIVRYSAVHYACHFCDAACYRGDEIVHAPDCPWLAAHDTLFPVHSANSETLIDVSTVTP